MAGDRDGMEPWMAWRAPVARRDGMEQGAVVAWRDNIVKDFRFEDFEIWQMACDVGDDLCTIADKLNELKL